MKAKEMFEELGYKQEMFELEIGSRKIPHLRYSDTVHYSTVSFQLKDKFFSMTCIDKNYEDLFKAIIQQCKELEWLDE